MNFQTLMGSDCGQSNPISQLMQHVTDDQGFQERVGGPYTSGLNQNNLVHPQSFRMNDIMKELEEIETSPSHTDLQTQSSFGTTWTTEYQNQTQYSQVRNEQIWNNKNNLPNYGNETNYFSPRGFINPSMNPSNNPSPLYGLPESTNFIKTEHQLISQFETKSQDPRKGLADFEGGIRIENVEELKILNQLEENNINSQNVQNDQLTELLPETVNYKNERISIPEWTNATDFNRILNKCLDEFRSKMANPDFQKRTPVTVKDVLNTRVYTHFKNNPVRDEVNLFEKGREAKKNGCYTKAALYFDEIIRRNEATSDTWFNLSYALYQIDQDGMAIAAIKHYLRLQPDCFHGLQILRAIYNKYGCKYQACQTILYWFKSNKSYNHLIPPNFTMDDQDSTELEENLLNSVKNLLLKAVREDPKNIDRNLQIMIGHLFTISRDFDKVLDCKLTATRFSDKLSGGDLYDMGYTLFCDDKPIEALGTFFEAAALYENKIIAYDAIGVVYTYLKNYRQAIHYFKKVLSQKNLIEESKFELKGNTLEDEYELCLRLMCEIRTQ